MTIREVGKIAAPLNAPGVAFQPGSTVRIDAVVRTRKIGHFFPAGTVDAFDVWLEVQSVRRKRPNSCLERPSGRWWQRPSGQRALTFIGRYLIDGDGNPINKRNAWQARSVFYVRLIPPGAADTVHYRIDCRAMPPGP